MKVIRFHPDAEAEMIEAAACCEAQQPELGRRFLASVQDAANRIVLNPQLYAAILPLIQKRRNARVPVEVRHDDSTSDSAAH